MGLREEGIAKGDGLSALNFAGSITITDCTCSDLMCTGGPARVSGYFFSTASFVGNFGGFEADLGSYGFYCLRFFIDEAQPNLLSGKVECFFGPWSPRPPDQTGNPSVPRWAAKGTWAAERE